MQDFSKNISNQTEPKTVIKHEPFSNFENKNCNVSTLSQIAEENKQTPIISNPDTDEYNFQILEYKPDHDSNYGKEYDPKKRVKE